MSDELYDQEHERILAAWRERTGHAAGAFYLLPPEAKEWARAEPVVDEPEFEAEFRTRADSDTNPDHRLVILPH